MRRLALIVPLALLLLVPAAHAAQPKCPLDVETCLRQFDVMKSRPWLGVYVDTDSTGRRVVTSVYPGSPADRAGVKPGDEIRRIGGMEPKDWFAGKAGWKDGDVRALVVTRGAKPVNLSFECHAIADDLYARFVGEHMIEAHLAYMDQPDEHPVH